MPGISVAAAIIVGLLSSFVQSLGLTIQRKSHLLDEAKPLAQRRRPIRRPLWLLGFGIYITSNVFSTIFQLDALPIVILAPLGAVSLIFNALLARAILGDTFGVASAGGTALVAVGAVLIAVFGVVPEEEHGLDELLVLFGRPAFVAFFTIIGVITLAVLLGAHFAAWTLNRQINSSQIGRIRLDEREDSTPSPTSQPSNYASPYSPPPIPFRPRGGMSRRWSSPVAADRIPNPTSHPSYANPAPPVSEEDPTKHVHFSTKAPSLSITIPPVSPSMDVPVLTEAQQRAMTLTGLSFAAASGALSGMSLVLAKAAVELLVITIDHYRTGKGENQFVRAQSWFLVVGLGVGAVLQLVYLNYSLTFASPALICPLAFCFFNLSSIFDGLVFYDQFGRLAPYQIALVSIGVLVLLVGVWVVSAIQPGQAVDVGTWVEDELSETTSLLSPREVHDSPISETPDSPTNPLAYNQPRTPTLPSGSGLLDGSDVPPSPSNPWSPRGVTRRHGPRYGTLIPDLAPHGAPTGFSIGLGAASPGFVLRSSSLSGHHGHGRGRSRSETSAGLAGIMGGSGGGMFSPTRSIHGTGDGEEGDGVSRVSGENEGERDIAEWQDSQVISKKRRKRWSSGWWDRFTGQNRSEGQIKLPPEGP